MGAMMANERFTVTDHPAKAALEARRGGRVDPPGGGGHDGDMEARVAKLEQLAEKTGERLASIDTHIAKIETRSEGFATKADLHDATLKLTHWVVGTAIALGATGLTVMTFVLNNAVPKQARWPNE